MAIARTPETAEMARPIRSKGTRTAGHNGHELRGGGNEKGGKTLPSQRIGCGIDAADQ